MDSDPEYGLRLPIFTSEEEQADLDELVDYVEAAKAEGFTHFWSIYHLLTTAPAYTTAWFDPLPTLAALAARVDDVKFGPLVLPLPLEHPVHVAKKYASLDRMSGGRVILGIGTGWNQEEFNALDISRKQRGQRTEEGIEVMQRLWSEDSVTFDGDIFELDDVTVEPNPTNGTIPVWIGGGRYARQQLVGEPNPPTVSRVLRRVARLADGWVPHAPNKVEYVKEDYAELEEFCDEFGRDVDDIDISYNQHIYVFESDDEEAEYKRARELFSRYSGMDWEDIKSLYLVGPPEVLVEKIERRIEATDGVDDVILNPITLDRTQLDLISNEIKNQL